MITQAFINAKPIIDTFEKHGYEAYFVGGAVRDYLLGEPIGDIDIATNATPTETMSLFEKTVPVGVEHGTVLVLHGNDGYEVTTYRVESDYSDFRRPEAVTFVRSLVEDLARRDFTINAIAMHPSEQLIDPYHGQVDLHNQLINTVGHAEERFSEDALRMMRAVRFCSQLNFTVTEAVKQAIKSQHHLLQNIAAERIQVEWFKLFAGKNVKQGLEILLETNMVESLPLLKEDHNVIQRLSDHVESSIEHHEVVLALSSLLSDSWTLSDWVKAYRCSNQQKREANELIEAFKSYQTNGLTNQLLYQLGRSRFPQFIQLLQQFDFYEGALEDFESMYSQLPIHSRKDIAIEGNQLLNLRPDKRKGPWIGDYLQLIEGMILSGELSNQYEAIERQVKQWKEQEKD
ncbi:CCA tRNA nucleotidyltransferase [Alkalibacillus almallahensis]|uniref:CCA tRNA nucleotidyltransferase n=1 Tax=Alkalibacillus almallahensis TaxID=1379154 RepID=UPI001420E8A5|nr:CCA tRNA nucleotidyltransferase [Alkalibacillus almallahensis]NIK12287.1 tRNA nucleotidyltransferase (CCA-adding enzyme) [Alkalibacillus almallahensis]